ncbi:MAG: AAA family ATPase [Deltaproteobacteria bacterium]|jgi:hypothetical protein|nr:AAA family ATPase [Deltaproteobacteria bacterium]
MASGLKRKRKRKDMGRIHNQVFDKNERFVLRHTADLLIRHLDRYPVLDEEILELICWNLGDNRENLSKCLVEQLEDDDREDIEEELSEAILIMDEAESLLFSRDRARSSWEISLTNEFLTSMERFRGILICTSNRMKDLDSASIRRFNHKVSFGFLTSRGNVIFYRRLLSSLIKSPLDRENENRLIQIADLSPGDFKTVRDRYSFHPSQGLKHETLVGALEEEAMVKKTHSGGNAIGF